MTVPPNATVPVSEVTVAAYGTVFRRLSAVLDLAWLPLLMLLAVALLPAALPQNFDGGTAVLRALPDFLYLVAGALCVNAFGVRWYQTQLFGSAVGRPWLRPWARFLLYTFVLYGALGAVLSVLLLLTVTIGDRGVVFEIGLTALDVAVAAALLWLMARFSLLYPAAAAGAPIGIGGAWRATRDNGWRIVLCWLLTTAPLLLSVQMILGAVFAGFDLGDGKAAPMGLLILRGLIGTVADFLIAALGAAVLSTIYRRLIQSTRT